MEIKILKATSWLNLEWLIKDYTKNKEVEDIKFNSHWDVSWYTQTALGKITTNTVYTAMIIYKKTF